MGMRLKENGARSYRFPSLATGVALGGHLSQTTMRFRQRRKVGKGALASRLPGPIHIHHYPVLTHAIPQSTWSGESGCSLKEIRLRSEEHTSELQSQSNLVCRLLLEKKNHI